MVGVASMLLDPSSLVQRTITSSGVGDGLFMLMTCVNRDVYYKAVLMCCIDVGAQIQV